MKVPDCFGDFESKNNSCNTCDAHEVCKEVIDKKRLLPIFQRVEKIAAVLKGES